MLLVQKWPFLQLFFLGNFSPENVFNAILERANAFLSFKKTEVQKVEKIDIFPKGLTHAFGTIIAIFSTFFFRNVGQENVFYHILERKNTFLGYKDKKFKKSSN